MWTKNIIITIIVLGLILFFPGMIGLILSLIGKFTSELIFAEITLIFLGLFFSGLGFTMKIIKKHEYRIREEGIPGKAKILKWWVVGKQGGSVDLIERCGFQLEISTEKAPPYEIKHSQLVRYNIFNQLRKGLILPVKIDQRNPKKAVILWDEGT